MSLRILASVLASLGSENKRVDIDETIASIVKADDQTFDLAASAGGGTIVPWTAAGGGAVATPRYIAIVVDPDDQLSGDPVLSVLITPAAGTAFALKVAKSAPLLLGSNSVSNSITAVTSTISSISIRNEETSVLRVRVVLFSL